MPQGNTIAAAAASAGLPAEEGWQGNGESAEPALPAVEQRRVDRSEQLGRNDPCWCGSGKKFKKCHGA
jgi:preprotein translocase subunit SecA